MARHVPNPLPGSPSGRPEIVLAPSSAGSAGSAAEAVGRAGQAAELTGLDVRREHRVLAGFAEGELAALRLLPEGTTLGRYRRYVDLHDPGRADFVAEGHELVRPGQRVVPLEGTPVALWEQLRRACGEAVSRRPRTA